MKLEITTQDFLHALEQVSKIPGAHAASPYTQCVRLVVAGGKITLHRFTAEAQISVYIECKNALQGMSIADHAALLTLVSRMPGKTLALKTDKDKLRIKSDSVSASLLLITEENAIEPPEPELETESAKILIEDFVQMLEICAPAMGKNPAKPMLSGICFCEYNGRFAMIASDGRRGHVALSALKLPVRCLVSPEAVGSVLAALARESGACQLSIGERTLSITSENVELTVALVNESFPVEGMLGILEKTLTSKVSKWEIPRDPLVNALKRLSTFGEAEEKFVDLSFSKNRLLLSASNRRDTEIATTLDCKGTTEETLRAPAVQLFTALELMKPSEDGTIGLEAMTGMIFARQEDRMVFIALARG